jgi:hypothetical protein
MANFSDFFARSVGSGLDLSRCYAALIAHVGRLAFEGQGLLPPNAGCLRRGL